MISDAKPSALTGMVVNEILRGLSVMASRVERYLAANQQQFLAWNAPGTRASQPPTPIAAVTLKHRASVLPPAKVFYDLIPSGSFSFVKPSFAAEALFTASKRLPCWYEADASLQLCWS